jgi:hypothetical protein
VSDIPFIFLISPFRGDGQKSPNSLSEVVWKLSRTKESVHALTLKNTKFAVIFTFLRVILVCFVDKKIKLSFQTASQLPVSAS